MKLTHGIKTTSTSLNENTDGFSVETNCHAVMFDNMGLDDVKVFFNDNENFAIIKAAGFLSLKADNQNEILIDEIKIEFESENAPALNIIKQTKSLL
jgi:hypothetical protein